MNTTDRGVNKTCIHPKEHKQVLKIGKLALTCDFVSVIVMVFVFDSSFPSAMLPTREDLLRIPNSAQNLAAKSVKHCFGQLVVFEMLLVAFQYFIF